LRRPRTTTTPGTLGRREFLAGLGAGAFALGCRSRPARGPIVLRLSHSMADGPTALNVFGEKFRDLAEAATDGAVQIRVFANGTLGQEREVVQQLQEGLVDFMVSGTAIWGSVAPKLQVFDFPFLWHDWAHVHGIVDGRIGQEAADYLERTVRMRPFAWGDSFGFRQVVTRSRDVTEPRQLVGLKIRTIQSSIYVKAIQLMGASPTPMAFGEVYTSLQTGVIDGYEHDASTTLHQRFYEVARYMARTRHIAGVVGLWASTAGLSRLSGDLRAALERAAREAARQQRAMGPQEDMTATAELAGHGMTIREIDGRAFRAAAERLWDTESRALGVTPWLEAIREGLPAAS
jgi:tripartite ATP-independent transporter DctP family solute receptor